MGVSVGVGVGVGVSVSVKCECGCLPAGVGDEGSTSTVIVFGQPRGCEPTALL